MAVVKEDLIEGNNADLGFNGWEFSRTFVVSELTGPGYAMAIEAYDNSGVPKMNDKHPSIADAYVVNVTPESISGVGNAMRLVYTYRQLIPNIQITTGVHSTNVRTQKYFTDPANSKNRSEMVLTYPYPSDYLPDPDKAGTEEQQGVDLDVSMDLPDFTYSRTEWAANQADVANGYILGAQLTGQMLIDRGLLFNNTLNKANWTLRPSASAGGWRLKMTAESTENTFDWRVTYNFVSDLEAWKYPAVYQDPQLDQPVPDPVFESDNSADGSSKNFDQYLLQNFNLLGLS
jgi:hypothetical protein